MSSQNSIQKMAAFIQTEAEEKAREIRDATKRQISIDTQHIKQEGRQRVNKIYEKKMKDLETEKKINMSNLEKEARLSVLKQRQDRVKQSLEKAKENLDSIVSDTGKYKTLLKNLSIQALFTLQEKKATLYCLQRDLEVVKSLKNDIVKGVEEKGLQLELTVHEEKFLKNTKGGVVASGYKGRIRVDNTLEERLEAALEQDLPYLRSMLFQNRDPNLY
mmetsp:Transcript_3720/g.5501  ORF Transcript_3720/g.5501 Transcript_3720/m.5501 type:complete len:218 (+) Transcript_3720:50-703(+)